MKKKLKILVMLLVALVIASSAKGKIIYVDDNGPADFNNLQAAIDAAHDNDTVVVESGTYIGPGNYDIRFNGKAIIVRSTYPDDPNIVAETIIDCNNEMRGFFFLYNDVNCTLNGLTITNAYYYGIICYGNPKIVNCIITNNGRRGIVGNSCNPTISNCKISNNSGGGIEWESSGEPVITNCTISGNTAEHYLGGGGILYTNAYFGTMTIKNCIISSNSTKDSGGGIYFDGHKGGTLDIINCTITGNIATNGGGMYYDSCANSEATITNCIFSDNVASKGMEICLERCYFGSNCGNVSIAYSNIHGGQGGVYIDDGCQVNWGPGNIDSDPRFVQSGYWGPSPFASEPNPADGAINVSLTADLSWTAGHDAVSHDVYFGTSYPPPFIINQTSTTFDPGTMAYSKTYYWRIDEVDNSGTTAGDIWSFTTIMVLPPPPPPPGTPLSISAASSMSDNQQYTWVEGDYHLLPDSPCIDAGDPEYLPEPNETDLYGRPRVLDGNGDAVPVVDMGAYESIPPIPAEIRFSPSTINVESNSEWITCYIRLPDGFNVADIDTNSILLEYTIEPGEFWINESKQTAMAMFRYEEVRVILEIGEIELSIIGWLTDKTVFVGTDVIKVTDKGGRGPAKNLQASVPNITDVSVSANLSWTAGFYATSHNVYFGTSDPPPFVRNQKETTFYPGTMDYETRYYWRIDEVSKWGVTTGQLWSFTTIEVPPPPPGPKPPAAPPGCFPADTPVWIDGEQVQFSKVAAGRKVGRLDATYAASCFEKPEPLKEIESVLEYQGTDDYYNIVLENGNRINVVHSHYFLTASDQWIRVENLKAGSKLQSLNGPIPIKTISKSEVPFTGRFYNLKIKGGDRYFVGKDGVTVRGH